IQWRPDVLYLVDHHGLAELAGGIVEEGLVIEHLVWSEVVALLAGIDDIKPEGSPKWQGESHPGVDEEEAVQFLTAGARPDAWGNRIAPQRGQVHHCLVRSSHVGVTRLQREGAD